MEMRPKGLVFQKKVVLGDHKFLGAALEMECGSDMEVMPISSSKATELEVHTPLLSTLEPHVLGNSDFLKGS